MKLLTLGHSFSQRPYKNLIYVDHFFYQSILFFLLMLQDGFFIY